KYLRLLRSKPALRTSHHSAILCGSVHAAMGELLPGENSSSQNHSHRKAPWLRRPISMPTSAQRDIKMSESAESEVCLLRCACSDGGHHNYRSNPRLPSSRVRTSR